jgi:ABC-type sulfate/molybdate transport systems ATPase subunit
VLADEPTGELDSKTGDEIYRILREMQESFQTTLVIVTHDRRFIASDDLVLEIQDGQVTDQRPLTLGEPGSSTNSATNGPGTGNGQTDSLGRGMGVRGGE